MEFLKRVLVVHGCEKQYHNKLLTTLLEEVHLIIVIYSTITIIVIDFIANQMITP